MISSRSSTSCLQNFKYHGFGHLAIDCPNRRLVILLEKVEDHA